MPISSGSRYASSQIVTMTDARGVTRKTILPPQPQSRTFTVTDYTWTADDRADLLAARVYGDETKWWVIANANPAILDWTYVKPGTIVRVPSDVA